MDHVLLCTASHVGISGSSIPWSSMSIYRRSRAVIRQSKRVCLRAGSCVKRRSRCSAHSTFRKRLQVPDRRENGARATRRRSIPRGCTYCPRGTIPRKPGREVVVAGFWNSHWRHGVVSRSFTHGLGRGVSLTSRKLIT